MLHKANIRTEFNKFNSILLNRKRGVQNFNPILLLNIEFLRVIFFYVFLE